MEFAPSMPALYLEPVIFSEIEALKSPRYLEMFEQARLPRPIGPIAPVALILTADGYIAATKRGTGTPKYPGGIWGMGGDIDEPTLSIGDHLLKRESIEEFHTDTGRALAIHTLGIVYDKVLRKHDLPVFWQYPVAFAAMRKGASYLPDVASFQ